MIKKILLWIAVIFLSTQIFGFSAKNAEESAGASSKIAESVVTVIEKIFDIDAQTREDVFHAVHLTVRKGAHFAEFALLGVLTFFLTKSYNLKTNMCAIISLGYCLLFAATDEFHQLFVPGRSGQISDVVLDFCGAVFGALCSFTGIKIKNRFFDKK